MASSRRISTLWAWVPIALVIGIGALIFLPGGKDEKPKISVPGTDSPATRQQSPQAAIGSRDHALDTAASVVSATQKPHEPWILRSEALMLAPSIAELALAFERDGLRTVEYRLFHDLTVTLDLTNHQIIDQNSSVIIGRVKGDPLSQVILSHHGSAQAGSILSPTYGYHLQISNNTRQGWVQVTEIDQESLSRQLRQPKEPPETRNAVHSLQTVVNASEIQILE